MDLNKLVDIDSMRIDKDVLLGLTGEAGEPYALTEGTVTQRITELAKECPGWEEADLYLHEIEFTAWTAKMQYWLNIKAMMAEEKQDKSTKFDPFDIIVNQLKANNYSHLDLSYNHPLYQCDFAKMVHEKTGWILFKYERKDTNDGRLGESYRFEDPKTNRLYHLATSAE